MSWHTKDSHNETACDNASYTAYCLHTPTTGSAYASNCHPYASYPANRYYPTCTPGNDAHRAPWISYTNVNTITDTKSEVESAGRENAGYRTASHQRKTLGRYIVQGGCLFDLQPVDKTFRRQNQKRFRVSFEAFQMGDRVYGSRKSANSY